MHRLESSDAPCPMPINWRLTKPGDEFSKLRNPARG